jgi:CRP-like cAMP-binding protein
MKGVSMLLAERVDIIGLIEDLPPFRTCTTEVLESYLAHDAMRAHCGPGEVLCGLEQDHNLYVIVSGEAVLHVGPDVSITLTPGDYIGQQLHRRNRLSGSVIASTEAEVLVVGPQDLLRLELESSASRHPSRFVLPPDLSLIETGPQRRLFRRGH